MPSYDIYAGKTAEEYKKFYADTSKIKEAYCRSLGVSLDKCSFKCKSKCFPLNEKPSRESKVVGHFDHYDNSLTFKGKPYSPSPSYVRVWPGEGYDNFRDQGFLVVEDVRHIVSEGRIHEWLKLPSPEKGTEVWYEVTPFGVAPAPKDAKEGSEIPVDYSLAYVTSLKHKKITERYCIEDIKNGEVSFYHFMFSAGLGPTGDLGRKYYDIKSKSTSKYLRPPEDIGKLREEYLKLPVVSSEPLKDPLVQKYLAETKQYRPQLFKMPLDEFYYKYLNRNGYDDDNYFLSEQPIVYPFMYPMDCKVYSDYFFKDFGGFEERKKMVFKYPAMFYRSMSAFDEGLLTGGMDDEFATKIFIKPRFLETKTWQYRYDDFLQRYIYWPNPVPAELLPRK